eukprot:GHUV01052760.1.p1 GENE.GHUV01052760.1~~GHUV01052760.1.p1  ORF type:complete len:122 (-),score=5.97 GHUV01052760.1:258-623(-)
MFVNDLDIRSYTYVHPNSVQTSTYRKRCYCRQRHQLATQGSIPGRVLDHRSSYLPLCCAVICRLENTLNYGMERVWAVGVMKGSNNVAFGFDEGVSVVKIGKGFGCLIVNLYKLSVRRGAS